MANVCTICKHKKRAQIDVMLADSSIPLRAIVGKYPSVSRMALTRHGSKCLTAIVRATKDSRAQLKHEMKPLEDEAFTKAIAARAEEQAAIAITVEGVVNRGFQCVLLLLDACDADLRDPDEPHRYNLNPRAQEIEVVYDEMQPGTETDARPKWARKKRTLQELLDLAFAGGNRKLVRDVPVTHNDRAALLLKATSELSAQTEFLARLEGRFLPVEKELGQGTTIQMQTIINVLVMNGILK